MEDETLAHTHKIIYPYEVSTDDDLTREEIKLICKFADGYL